MQPQGAGDITFDFTDRTVVVFGGTSGINYGIAEAFGRCGARVVVASRRQPNVDGCARTARGQGVTSVGFAADVRDSAAVNAVFDEVAEQWGAIDVTGIGRGRQLPRRRQSVVGQGFQTVVDIDLFGTFHCCGRVSRIWHGGASVINISAPQASVPMRYQVHVGAAKAGVDQLTRILALEWAAHGIRVNAISPGPIEGTDGLVRLSPDGDPGGATAVEARPARRLGTKGRRRPAGDVPRLVAASYISGAVILVTAAAPSIRQAAIEEAGRAMSGRSAR